jgi:hypothetical protein
MGTPGRHQHAEGLPRRLTRPPKFDLSSGCSAQSLLPHNLGSPPWRSFPCANCSTTPPKRLRHSGLQRQQPGAGAGRDAAADEVGAPVILQASAGARKYAGEPFIKHLIQAATEQWPHIPLVMHQDHGQSPEVCQGAIDLGFGSVMMDGSLMEDGKTPPASTTTWT